MSQTQSRTVTLVARDLKKSYSGFEAVKGVDFEVFGGECFGFLGPNGAGKTTTMKMIYGAVIPTGGELAVAGLDVYRHEREIKRRIGVVPQENNLDDELKVEENLLIYGRYYDLPSKLVLRRAEELLDFMQLSDKAERHGRAALWRDEAAARSSRGLCINDPEIVVLDEPTTGLDPQARHLVWDRLTRAHRRGQDPRPHHPLHGGGRAAVRPARHHGGGLDHRRRDARRRWSRSTSARRSSSSGRTTRSRQSSIPFSRPASDAVERTGDESILAYTDDADELLERVRGSGVEVENTVYRQAGLEDVFLRLTGRRLVE